MKLRRKHRESEPVQPETRQKDSIWRRELIPPDSIWRKELIPPDSVWGRDIFSLGKPRSACLQCPVLMVKEERRCNRFQRIPDDIWSGIEDCPLYK